MRVTADMMVAQSVRRLSKRMEGYERVQQQVASGKKFTKPSQQPADANTAMALRAARRSREQEQRAAADAESWLNVVDAQMQGAVDRLLRLRDLTVSASSSINDSQRQAVAIEMEAVQSELASIANAEHRGKPLFGGFSQDPPVTKVGTTWTVSANTDAIMRKVGEQDTVRINVTASEAFTFGGTDVFTMIDDLVGHVRTGDHAAVAAELDRVDEVLQQIGAQQGRIGAATNHLESALSRNYDMDLAIRGQLAKTEDIDIAEAVMELQVQQTGFEATLKAIGMALPPSLVTFL